MVDAEVLARNAIADYLRRCGYIVIEAASTDEAEIVMLEEAIHVDVILCDAQASGRMNPFELRSWAARNHRPAQIILAGNIVTAAHKAAELCDRGPNLARPYDPQGVVDYIRRLLGGLPPESPGSDSQGP